MKVLTLSKLGLSLFEPGLSLSAIAFSMVPCFESIPLILRLVAYELTCFMKGFDFG